MDTSSVSKCRPRQVINVIQSQSVRRSPRLSGRFQSHATSSDSDLSLGRSSLVTTFHTSHITRNSNSQNVVVLDESGQSLPANEPSGSSGITRQLFYEKKSSIRQPTSYSSTTGQPYTGSPVEVGTESSEDSDVDAESHSPGFELAPNVASNVTDSCRGARSTSFRSRRTDMPCHLFGLDDDVDGESVEYVKRQRFIHHKEKILTPPRTSKDTTTTTDGGDRQSWFTWMFKKVCWSISSFFYLISTYLLYVDVKLLRRSYSLLNPMVMFYQRISNLRQRSFGSFCYLLLLAVTAVPLVCVLCGVTLVPVPEKDVYIPGDEEIRALVRSILREEMPSQLETHKGNLEDYYISLITREMLGLQESIMKREADLVESMNRSLLEKFYAVSGSVDKKIEGLRNHLNKSFIALVTQLEHDVDRNLSWSEANISVNLTNQREVQLRKMNDTYQLIFQHQRDMLVQLKDENKNLLKETKGELFDVIESKALETNQKRELMAAKLEKVVTVTQKLDESVLNLENSLQELSSITDLLLKNGSSNITTVLQQLNNVTSEIVYLRKNFQDEVNSMRQSQKNESEVENKMASVFKDELNKVLSDGNSTLLIQFDKLFATTSDLEEISEAMRILNKSLENVAKLGTTSKEVPISGNLTEDVVLGLIKKELDKYSADRLEKFDFALHSAGGLVTNQRSPTFNPNSWNGYVSGWLSYLQPREANAIIDPSGYPGQCWAFPGQEGFVVIQLSAKIEISEVVVEHLPKTLSPFDDISSAPNEFSVLLSETLEDNFILVGDFIYTGEKLIHVFEIKDVPKNLKSVQYVKFDFKSNHGKKEFTCIYRLRVHGRIKENQKKPS